MHVITNFISYVISLGIIFGAAYIMLPVFGFIFLAGAITCGMLLGGWLALTILTFIINFMFEKKGG
ncbi:MAG: holin S [Podoviridae sp. ctLUJ1]|nr:MAG: holin S [Podoviridae sp. ctLUJ1]